MNFKQIALAGALIAGFSGAVEATVIKENFANYANGTVVTTQVQGVAFSLIGGPLASGSKATIYNGGLMNSNTSYYPTANILDVDFLGLASGVSFKINNAGFATSGLGHTSYTAYASNGSILESGYIGSGGTFTLTSSNIADLRFNNGGSGGSWYFVLNSLSANVSDVPEPGSLALLGLGLAGFAASRRKRSA